MITLEFFAGLKDYFPAVMSLEEIPNDIGSLRRYLRGQKPLASALLEQCRFAVDDTFIDEDYRPHHGDIVLVIPPSSGG
ncbi:MoaD/ThiS family protein [Sphingobacterium gobiense]|uniref:Molybdopterin synthase sulfur carrier subunit n=1 Tax=Sphingobacterium gobiense TaxID=1382456 RepID=A0A2S9JLE7_9SPHI|nr:MoaD/ThiS family protein [Sphingobacterium gobiense]PRD53977.1 molybdopterin synthase sulfur carrier subunit [Sphingobacterium gobiense]